jgi:hypothetical protein
MRMSRKAGVLLALLGMLAVLVAACTASPGAAEEVTGAYEFAENIYISPISSTIPVKGSTPDYRLTDKALIIDQKGGPRQEIPGVYTKKRLQGQEFASLFGPDMGIPGSVMPDLSRYKRVYQYAVFTAPEKQEYRLYKADSEVWLAELRGGRVWSLDKLVKTD